MLSITGGIKKGQNISTISSDDLRPASSRLRLAIFNIIDADGKTVLDLFAGSGILGLEALSRSAASADFVESDGKCIRTIKENVEKLGFVQQSKVIRSCAFKFTEKLDKSYDLAFVDPPFRYYYNDKVFNKLELLLERLCTHCIIVIVKHPEKKIIRVPKRTNNYGDSSLSFYGK